MPVTEQEWDTSEMEARMKLWVEQVREGAADALEELAKDWLTEGNRTVPIESGLLADGATAVDREGLEAMVGWGFGVSRAYAIRQHEDTSLRHDAGRGPKWGERAGRVIAKGAAAKIVAKIKARTGG